MLSCYLALSHNWNWGASEELFSSVCISLCNILCNVKYINDWIDHGEISNLNVIMYSTPQNPVILLPQDCGGVVWSDLIHRDLATLANNLPTAVTFGFKCSLTLVGSQCDVFFVQMSPAHFKPVRKGRTRTQRQKSLMRYNQSCSNFSRK